MRQNSWRDSCTPVCAGSQDHAVALQSVESLRKGAVPSLRTAQVRACPGLEAAPATGSQCRGQSQLRLREGQPFWSVERTQMDALADSFRVPCVTVPGRPTPLVGHACLAERGFRLFTSPAHGGDEHDGSSGVTSGWRRREDRVETEANPGAASAPLEGGGPARPSCPRWPSGAGSLGDGLSRRGGLSRAHGQGGGNGDHGSCARAVTGFPSSLRCVSTTSTLQSAQRPELLDPEPGRHPDASFGIRAGRQEPSQLPTTVSQTSPVPL